MKKLFYFLFAASALVACVANEPVSPDVNPEETYNTEYIEFCANVLEAEDGTRVSFDYTTLDQQAGFYTRWEGNEEMDVYIHSGSTYSFAGRIPVKEGSLSADRFSVRFAGEVIARTDPSTQSYIMVYTNSGARYDWTKQTIDFSEQGAGADGTKALKSYSPMVFEMDSQGIISVTNKACYIRFKASGLAAGAKVKSLAISSANAVFPKTFDLSRFDYQSDNKSKVLSYAFDNLVATDGSIDIFLAAPVIGSTEKNYDIHIVTEKDGVISTVKARTGITSAKALSQSKLYNLTRSDFDGATNPATVVGNPATDNSVIESIVGQWDKTGYLSNDIYGVLDMGKPENLTYDHNASINAIYKIYNAYFTGNTDSKIHRGAVEVAGKAGEKEGTDLNMSANGPQYVNSYDNTETFNNIVLTKDTEVYMTFIDSKAWNTNTIGYYCYPSSNEESFKTIEGHSSSHEYVVFPSTSQNDRNPNLLHKFEAKTTAQLLYPSSTGTFSKIFPEGTTIGLMERVNALVKDADFALKPISDDSPVHYTNIAWNRLNTLGYTDLYWNQIAVLKFKMPEDKDFNRHGLIYAMKDKYAVHGAGNQAANWTNPIILIYTSEPDAIQFDRSKDYWTHIVEIGSEHAHYKLSYNLESVTSSAGQSTTTFSADSYSTTLRVANSEFGDFSTLKVMSGSIDITSKVVKSNNGQVAEITINKNDLCGDVVITAHASRKIMVQSLTAEDLNNLGKGTGAGDLPHFRLILHAVNRGAFGITLNGVSHVLGAGSTPFNNNTYPEATQVMVQDQYNDYEWSIEQAKDGSGNVIGFCLKKVTKYTDEDVRTDGFIFRGEKISTYYPLVTLRGNGTALIAETCNNNQYEMKIKSFDNSYNYMSCAFGSNLLNAVFAPKNGHVDNYGVWRVYKVWLE